MNNYKCRKIISINSNEDLVFHKEEYLKIIDKSPHGIPISIISITVLLKQNSARSEESLRFIYLADWHAAK